MHQRGHGRGSTFKQVFKAPLADVLRDPLKLSTGAHLLVCKPHWTRIPV